MSMSFFYDLKLSNGFLIFLNSLELYSRKNAINTYLTHPFELSPLSKSSHNPMF